MLARALDSITQAQDIRLRRNRVMTSTPKKRPRLTVALRAFGGLSSDASREPAFIDERLIKRKRTRKADDSRDEKAWTKLRDDITSQCTKSDALKVVAEFRNLQQAAREIVGSDMPQLTVDSASAFLFTLFQSDPEWSRHHGEEIRKILGPFPASEATKAYATVKRILSYLPEKKKKNSEDAEVEREATRKEFGLSIVFKFGVDAVEAVAGSRSDSNEHDSLSDSDDSKPDAFTNVFLQGLKSVIAAEESKQSKPLSAECSSQAPIVAAAVHSGAWLKEECQKCAEELGGMSSQELFGAVFDLLSSAEDSNVIQNELAELLGLNRLDLIQELLTHRCLLVDSILQEGQSLAPSVVRPGKASTTSQPSQLHRPVYGSQVIIQSEDEKKIKKLLRKEEKKQAKKEKDGHGEEDQASYLRSHGFDPFDLRVHREQALAEAAIRPILSDISFRSAEKEQYPFVFDSMAKVKASAAYVDTTKLLLPEEAVRKNDSRMEEITIPHTCAPPPPVGEARIRVADLDEVARLAFKGVEYLNRIQSIVFDAAYTTNENLLISAPTGAGKTNIAMLAVLHEVKNNIDHMGVLRRNQFKIIYVAPMKALAAEMVRNFSARLSPLGVVVKELTGDMQLTKHEIFNTQMIVTTPEKWDVVTRKATGDVQLAQIVRLLIIDEVHLLHEDRGAVIESLVARTLRQVESTQTMIRIVGLSATLPNYLDVARFLRVNPYQGLFFFDGRFRPVPLTQSFVGVKVTNQLLQMQEMERICYEKALENVRQGYQVMVFVHARNATGRTATVLRDMAKNEGTISFFITEQSPQLGAVQKQVSMSRNKQLRDLFGDGFSIHHAGMLRQDRNLVERLFRGGFIKVLVCTATLAWGVNLPAHAVIIKGTQIYNAKKGAFVDIGILDVLQIFGRAGRPQYDTFGEGTIITAHSKLPHYLALLTQQQPIESQLVAGLVDNLNAEICLGTINNIDEAVEWLSYTYLYVRMRLNPLAYGIPHNTREMDPDLEEHRRKLIITAAKDLDKAKMIRYVEKTGTFHATDLGRTASNYYIKYNSIETFNELMKPHINEAEILAMVSKSQEFDQVKVRDDEIPELELHMEQHCNVRPMGGVENSYGKVNILLQCYISQVEMESFSLTSDLAYISQNAGRVMRGLFDIALRNGWPSLSSKLLTMSKVVERRMWSFEHPLKQFGRLKHDVLEKLENTKSTLDRMKDMTADELGHIVRHVRMGETVKQLLSTFPSVSLSASIQPITRTVLRVRLSITPDYVWDDRIHGSSDPWWIWVEDPENNFIYHSECYVLQKKMVQAGEPQELVFAIPIFEPLPAQYYVRAISDRWLGAEAVAAISFQHLILPEVHPPHTKLLDLHPLPVSALKNTAHEQLFKFEYFNPVQTQIFHTLFHSDVNVLLGAPTGSGKTVAAELAMLRVFNCYPGSKCVYIAPLKALVRERVEDWKEKFERKLQKRVVELTGDTTPDIRAIEKADIIVTTPEKWDGISRSWQNRSYVQAMRLLVIDEIHLLGDERGPVLEVIVSRTNFIASHTKFPVRIVGLSTAVANAQDLADWLGIKQAGLFNFHPAVRPVQLEVHIQGFPGKHYCPRMATMNKPVYSSITMYSPEKPTLVFVSSRRQTRITAFDLMAYLGSEHNPKQWLHMDEADMDAMLHRVHDPNLKTTLALGIGLHHAGLIEGDRKLVEKLFVNQKIQVLIATSTLAWGVNFPAHLVVVKGTEYYDGKTQRYVDYPITDVLQMMGRAGRPQFDDKGVAVILVQDAKKHFYKKFLYEPFPVESNLLKVLPDHLNAEIVAGTIGSKQDAMDYITWTYFFRRLIVNPSYYQLEDPKPDSINNFLSEIVQKALLQLDFSYCIEVEEDGHTLHPSTLGCIASFYYLHHTSIKLFREKLFSGCTQEELLKVLCDSAEYDELPVRHNEDDMNRALAATLPLKVDPGACDSPHTKAYLLLQAHFCQSPLPIADYVTDTKSVLDQSIRILQALVDIAASEGWLATTLRVATLVQMCVQGTWSSQSSLLTLPHLQEDHIAKLNAALKQFPGAGACGVEEVYCLAELLAVCECTDVSFVRFALDKILSGQQVSKLETVLQKLPLVSLQWKIKNYDKSSSEKESMSGAKVGTRNQRWLQVPLSEECVVQVELNRTSMKQGKYLDGHAYAPHFPKTKDEGWWIIIGEVDTGELLALKRVGIIRNKTTVSLAISPPESPVRKIYTVYLISDAYLGLDQQYDMYVEYTAV